MPKKSYSRVRSVAARYDVSPSTVWRWSNEPRFEFMNFPKPRKAGPQTSIWDDDELDEFDERSLARRDEDREIAHERFQRIGGHARRDGQEMEDDAK
jgi:predicted DNA-binding transcriptional regulator AlpA